MADDEVTSKDDAASRSEPRIIKTSGLLAEYTTGQSVSGEWFALGSVRSELPLGVHQPAWLLVGTGNTAEDAVSRLLTELEHEAQRCFR